MIKPKPVVIANGNGHKVSVGGMTIEYLATSDLTDDAIGIYLLTLAANSPGAGPHYHQRMTEAFHIHSGVLSMMVDGQAVEAGAGDFVLVRPPIPHAFADRGSIPAVFTLIFTPALAREGFFESFAALSAAGRMDDREAMLKVMADYDQVPVDGIKGWTKST